MVSSYKTMGNTSNSNSDTIIVLLFMMISAFISSFISVVMYLNTRPKEGDVCTGEDENAEYKIDEKGKCQFEGCKSDYITSNHKCVKPLFNAPENFEEEEPENPDPAPDAIYDDQIGEQEEYEPVKFPAYLFGNITVPKNSVGVVQGTGEDDSSSSELEPGKLIRSRPNGKFGIHNDSSTGQIKLRNFDRGEFKVLLELPPGTNKETTSLKIGAERKLYYGDKSIGETRDPGLVRLVMTELEGGGVDIVMYGHDDGTPQLLYEFYKK